MVTGVCRIQGIASLHGTVSEPSWGESCFNLRLDTEGSSQQPWEGCGANHMMQDGGGAGNEKGQATNPTGPLAEDVVGVSYGEDSLSVGI